MMLFLPGEDWAKSHRAWRNLPLKAVRPRFNFLGSPPLPCRTYITEINFGVHNGNPPFRS